MEWLCIPFVAGVGGLVIGIIWEYLTENYENVKKKAMRFFQSYVGLIGSALLIAFSLWLYFDGIEFTLHRVDDAIISTAKATKSAQVANSDVPNSAAISGTKGDTFGGTLGPWIAFIGAVLTFAAFWVQIEANKKQRDDIRLERFENRFFKFIDYHRENVNTMKYRDPKSSREKYWEGNQVFTVIYYEIVDLLNEYLRRKYNGASISTFQKADAINFVYHCIFYGSGKHSLKIFDNKFKTEFRYINFKRKRAKYELDGKLHFYYTGHVRRLGHYFRNIFQAVKYVESQDFLTEYEKYTYVTILRAQMSVYEQALFFYNSLTEFGDVWEWKFYKRSFPSKNDKSIFRKLLITKYDFIRNSLNRDGEISENINIKEFYPLVNLERENEFKQIAAIPFAGNQRFLCRYCYNKKYVKYDDKDAESAIVDIQSENDYSFSFNCIEKRNCETNKVLRRSKVI